MRKYPRYLSVRKGLEGRAELVGCGETRGKRAISMTVGVWGRRRMGLG